MTVRIVNAENETPVKNKHVYVFGVSGNAPMKRADKRREPPPDLRLVTDANGEVGFDLPKPAPDYFFVHAVLSGSHWDCYCGVRVSTEDLLRKGFLLMSAYAKRKPNPKIQPRPGELLFVLRPTPWWERLFWPLLKG